MTRDGKALLATASDLGQHPLYSVDPASGRVTRLSNDGYVADFAAGRRGTVVTWHDLGTPPDLYLLSGRGAPRRLTNVNAALLATKDLSPFEQFSFKGWNDETVYAYAVQPADFSPAKKYPVAFLIHGGPQSPMGNHFHYRWNPQAYAGAGYGVVVVEFHGTPGYGQAFTDSIQGDWGGKPLMDLQKGLAAAIARYSWMDGNQVCALGASFGGYMINWIAGNWPDRFRCLVSHDGNLDERMAY